MFEVASLITSSPTILTMEQFGRMRIEWYQIVPHGTLPRTADPQILLTSSFPGDFPPMKTMVFYKYGVLMGSILNLQVSDEVRVDLQAFQNLHIPNLGGSRMEKFLLWGDYGLHSTQLRHQCRGYNQHPMQIWVESKPEKKLENMVLWLADQICLVDIQGTFGLISGLLNGVSYLHSNTQWR
ncbi:hypothetical protein MGYG_07923 [Nannizzia gypsea CBS 118893]|uniref:Uncharacterized protein n=1 Tax=Arthroderma gypseum (strain ATCC MYA-4604 / CBS 118893) TaxID=535722 RepID=E4V4J7_ARTGP|nr:hypothetical protein MGYG_07923 [Nannizzia gypsea CBS 118893]EFR04921.1 hypothetical protein MGYG_07923 [Nannizzia gypsea CBS 118893]